MEDKEQRGVNDEEKCNLISPNADSNLSPQIEPKTVQPISSPKQPSQNIEKLAARAERGFPYYLIIFLIFICLALSVAFSTNSTQTNRMRILCAVVANI
jgi:hypothetical protein